MGISSLLYFAFLEILIDDFCINLHLIVFNFNKVQLFLYLIAALTNKKNYLYECIN